MGSKANSFEFYKFNKKIIRESFSPREGETKIGEKITSLEEAKYIIIGVEESVGPRANFGRDGAENGFLTFLKNFLNMQSNTYLTGDNIHILGAISCVSNSKFDLRLQVEELDEYLFTILGENIRENQIPIVIGGGHNNAYPLIHFTAKRYKKAIDVINLDAHADYRPLEGRHSGNSFSYAFKENLIQKYFVLGLHQQYNSQEIVTSLRKDNHLFTFYEEYLMEQRSYLQDFKELKSTFLQRNNPVGVELDLDVIANMPSSASSPVGISIATARCYIRTMAEIKNISYLHLPEGGPQTDAEKRTVGKSLAYFVADFISCSR